MKKILSVALSAVMLLAMTATAFASYEEAIDYVTDRQYMIGSASGFEADASVTWAIACQTLYNLAGRPDVSDTAPPADTAGRWYADAAAWAKKTGLIKDATFRGDSPVTGQELTELVHNYASAIGKSCPEDAVASGESVTRGQLAQMLYSCAPWNESYTEEVVTFSVPEQDGIPAHEVVGTLTLPTNVEGAVPAVVMLHGTGSTRHEAGGGYDKAAPILAQAGLATLRIDFMGAGDSTASDVYYSPSSANIDAKAAADYLAALDNVNGDAIGVMGWSQGGMNALLAAAAYPDTFKAIVTWAATTGMRQHFEDFDSLYETAKKNGYTVTEFTWRDPMRVGLRWYEEMDKLDALEKVASYSHPILAIHGSVDQVVPPELAGKIIAASSNERSDVYMIEGCDHTFNMFSGDFTAIEDASATTANYFLENLEK